jgi:hypothetical protein
MDKQTKILLGLGALAVALYFVFKPKGSKVQKTCADDEVLTQVQCDKAPCNPICVKKSDYEVNCADGTTDVLNGIIGIVPCVGHGGVLPTR